MTDKGHRSPPPPPTRFGPVQPKAAPRAAVQAAGKKAGGYKISIGSYLHQGPGKQSLPSEVAGHSFVAIEGPGAKRQAWGFSPAGNIDLRADLPKLKSGVRGRVHADDAGFSKPGVRTQTFEVGPEQARAALAKVAEYRSTSPQFNLSHRQCSTFATDVLRAAKIDAFPGSGVRKPGQMYAQLTRPQPPKR